MLTNHIALVADGPDIPLPELMKVAAALQKQVVVDFGPIWGVSATVSIFATKADVPSDYWPIIIQSSLDDPDAGGYHSDNQGQPYALILYMDGWTVAASHELLEMLADPFGSRMVAGPGNRNYLVEVADPVEEEGYTINGIPVSDFVTPAYYQTMQVPGVRYCYSGRIDGPRQLRPGGYVAWSDQEETWYQRAWFDAAPKEVSLGKLTDKNLRSAIDILSRKQKLEAKRHG